MDVDGLAEEFVPSIQHTVGRFTGIDRNDTSFAALMAAQERIPAGEARDAFARDFLQVQGLWEFLDPSPVTNAHRNDYRWLAQVYESVQPTGTSDALLWHRLGAKTLEPVHGHITEVRVTGTGLAEVIVDADNIEAIRQLALLDPEAPPDDTPMTVGEALDTIGARIRRRLESSGNYPVYVALSERLERHRHRQLSQASTSVEFLHEILDLAQQVTAVERADDTGELDSISVRPDPNIGVLTQIFREYAPPDVPLIVENVVTDIDTIVRQVRFTGWTQTENGDRTVRREVRLTLKKYGYPRPASCSTVLALTSGRTISPLAGCVRVKARMRMRHPRGSSALAAGFSLFRQRQRRR